MIIYKAVETLGKPGSEIEHVYDEFTDRHAARKFVQSAKGVRIEKTNRKVREP